MTIAAPPKTLPLLAYLILHAGARLPRDGIAFALWPDETEDRALANLRRHLYHLTRALPPPPPTQPWFVSSIDGLQWNADAAWVDVFAFRRLLAGERDLEAAVDIYVGDLLEKYYDEWIMPERERLRTDYIHALYTLVLGHRRRRQWAPAIRRARMLLEADPWREDVVRQLMSVQYASGDRAGALRTYAEFCGRLRAEMAVDPMPETSALREQIARNAPLTEVSGEAREAEGTAAPTAARPPALPLVGRQKELEALRALWTRAAHGTTTFAVVAGEAGIGKSRLAAELALCVEAEGGRVMWGATSSPESGPYQALSQALHHALPLIAALPLESQQLAAAAALLPELHARRPGLPRLAPAKPEDERRRMLEAVAGILSGLARSRPLLVVLEDLHWAGEATCKGLAMIASRVRSTPLFVVMTHREEEVAGAHPFRWLHSQLARLGPVPYVAPGRLTRADVAGLVAQMPALAGDPRIADQLHERSEGHCLFLALMINDILDGPAAGRRSADGRGAAAAQAGPSHLDALIADRLARLTAAARSLAEVAATVGQGFSTELVSAVSGWSMDQVLDGVNELLDHRLIRELASPESFQYAFSHHLIRDTIYAQMPSPALVARHRRIARVLSTQPEGASLERAADLAHHFERGDEPDRAAPFYIAAARNALRLYADDEALTHLQKGLSAAHDPRLRADALLLLEDIHARLGLRDERAKDLTMLDALAEELGDVRLRLAALERRIAMERTLGNREQEARHLAAFERSAGEVGDPRWEARARLASASYAMHAGRLEAAQATAEQALCLLDGLGDADSEVEGLCLAADIQTQLGHLEDAKALLDRARKTAETGGQPALVARAYLAASRAAIMQHQFSDCLEAAQTAYRLFRSVSDREGEADALARQASVLARLQRYEEARLANREAAQRYKAIGKDEGLAAQLVGEGSLDARVGLLKSAEGKLLAAHDIFQRLGELRGLTVCALNLSFLYLVQRKLPQARRCARRALDCARRLNHKTFTAQALANLGAVERELGRLDQALEHMYEGLRIQEEMNRPADLVNDLADLALAHLYHGDSEAARATVVRMLSVAEGSTDAAFWPQGLFWVAARVYRACGQRKQTAELLRKARDYALRVESSLEDPVLRQHYRRLPVNQEIFEAYEHGVWPRVTAG